MLPFDAYPQQGRVLLGRAYGSTCRRGYGLQFMKKTGQTSCAYCGAEFTLSYEMWLTMEMDHVVPVNICKELGVAFEWTHDCANLVLACGACNRFNNRYRPSVDQICPTSLSEFFDLRDRIFAERKELIANSHQQEREFFLTKVYRVQPSE